jgi:integrase
MLERYKASTVQVSFQALRTAIRVYCRDHATPLIMPFGAPTRPPGCERVLTAEERDRILRWARGSESYDPKTGTWSQGRIGRLERHRRLMVGRLLELGLVTGTRGGRFEGLAWSPHPKFGHIDVETGLLHRCPPGALAPARKQAPPVLLPPGLLAEVRRWKAADGRQPYLFRTRKGGPAGAKLGVTFTEALQKLGIDDVTRHTLRHTCITGLIEQAVPASVIAAICGISVQMLRTRYNHSDDTAVQPLGHASMDRLLPRH